MEFDEDEEFLLQLAAAEAAALSSSTTASKRRRLSSAVVTPTPTSISTSLKISSTSLQNTTPNPVEGPYMAALRGSKSLEFQKQAKIFLSSSSVSHQSYKPYSTSNHSNSSFPTSDSGNTCFKCGKSGHWARDCDSAPINDEYGSANFPEKNCPCGLGICIVLTANTDKNRGRKFYKCPVRQENGGCDFFEWCDKPSFTYNTTIQNNSATNFSVLQLPCPCGAGPCLVLTAKTGNNIGQQFYRCPSQESCGFFKWCNETTNTAGSTESHKAPQFYQSTNGICNKSQNSATCFKCGKEGHWAKDCTQSLPMSSPADGGRKSTATTTCFKCGMPGHWSKDCTSVVAKKHPRAK